VVLTSGFVKDDPSCMVDASQSDSEAH